MANVNITQLPLLTGNLNGTELVPVDSGSTTYSISTSNIGLLANSSISGANITGNVTRAINVTGNSQPNITSVGTLSTLAVTGNIIAGNTVISGGNGLSVTNLQASPGVGALSAMYYESSSGNITYQVPGSNITISGDYLEIANDASISGNLTVGSNLNVVNVNEYVGATGNVSFTGNLIPGSNGNTYTMGLPGIPWDTIYANSIVYTTVAPILPTFSNTTARDAAITSPVAGMMVFVTGLAKAQCYDGTTWQNLF